MCFVFFQEFFHSLCTNPSLLWLKSFLCMLFMWMLLWWSPFGNFRSLTASVNKHNWYSVFLHSVTGELSWLAPVAFHHFLKTVYVWDRIIYKQTQFYLFLSNSVLFAPLSCLPSPASLFWMVWRVHGDGGILTVSLILQEDPSAFHLWGQCWLWNFHKCSLSSETGLSSS